MSACLTIVSCGLSPLDLSLRHQQAVADADILAGGQRLLSWFPQFSGPTITLGANAAASVVELVGEARRGKAVVVLASGDALFFGIAQLFRQHLSQDQLQILPNVTAAQAAMGRLCQPYGTARFFTVHGRDAVLPWRQVLRAPVAVVYGDGRRTPARLAQELVAAAPDAANRPAAILANLGSASEQIQHGSLKQLASVTMTEPLSMLVLLPAAAGWAGPELPLGLADAVYAHERGLITHAEIRAVVLAKLRLRAAGVMWDLGAGSGSVAVEAAGLCPELNVHAVEQNAERCRSIAANAHQQGCANVAIHEGDILTVMADLPDPNAVFIGGGGRQASAILEAAYRRLRPAARLVAAAVLAETQAALINTLVEVRLEVVELAVRRSRCIGPGCILQPENPVTLYVYTK